MRVKSKNSGIMGVGFNEYKRSDKILQINNVLHNSLRNAVLFTSTSFLLFKRSLYYKEKNDTHNERIFMILCLLTIFSSCIIILIVILDNIMYFIKLNNEDKTIKRMIKWFFLPSIVFIIDFIMFYIGYNDYFVKKN